MAQDSRKGMTPQDIRFFSYIADRMVRAGLWNRIDRYRTGDFDCFDIHAPNRRRDPLFSVGRCVSGLYVIMDHRDGSVKFGNSLDQALDLTDWIQTARAKSILRD